LYVGIDCNSWSLALSFFAAYDKRVVGLQVAEQSRHQQELQQKLEATTLMWQQRVAAVDKELIDTKTAQV
jgi:hypothetical protein